MCDLKPVFGQLFEDELNSFDFWAYSDLDLVWGDLSKFTRGTILDGTDILSFYPGFLSGPVTLYRNSHEVNILYRDCPALEQILTSTDYLGFDENIQRKEIMGVSLNKLLLLLRFLAAGHWKNSWKKDLRYHFQWYVKRKSIRPDGPVDMSEVVWLANKKGIIRAEFFPLLISDPYFSRIKEKHWKFTLEGKRLADEKTGNEFLGFHFQKMKSNSGFRVKPGLKKDDIIVIDDMGLHYE